MIAALVVEQHWRCSEAPWRARTRGIGHDRRSSDYGSTRGLALGDELDVDARLAKRETRSKSSSKSGRG